MASGNPDTVEQWAPIFLFFAGTTEPKFTKEQVLDLRFAILDTYCKLCDAHFEGGADAHMRMHRKELTAWLNKRRQEGRKRSKAGLATWRKEQEMAARAQATAIIAQVGADDNDE